MSSSSEGGNYFWYHRRCNSNFPSSHLLSILLLVIAFSGIILVISRSENDVMKAYSIGKCSCMRKSTMIGKTPPSSTCDDYSSSRGKGQRVVSYSYFGDTSDDEVRKRYFGQIEERAEEVKRSYPGWIMRLYYHITDGDFGAENRLCEVWCKHDHVDLCDVTRLPRPIGDLRSKQPIGRTWRFSVMLDPLIDVFLSRDLDSTILNREVSAVNAWLEANRTFHIMRDHPSHNGYMMAGLWGARNELNRSLIASLGREMLKSTPRDYWDFDQALLRRIVWPEARDDSVQHDAYFCGVKKFGKGCCHAFPERRQDQLYVGWGPVKGSPNRTGIRECPHQCRPEGHKEWVLC